MRLPGEPEPRLPRRPFRDSAILYAILSIVIVLLAYFTGGSLVKALLIALGFFVVATAWSWWRFRERLEQQRGQR